MPCSFCTAQHTHQWIDGCVQRLDWLLLGPLRHQLQLHECNQHHTWCQLRWAWCCVSRDFLFIYDLAVVYHDRMNVNLYFCLDLILIPAAVIFCIFHRADSFIFHGKLSMQCLPLGIALVPWLFQYILSNLQESPGIMLYLSKIFQTHASIAILSHYYIAKEHPVP